MIQNEVEVRPLPDGELLETLKFKYSVVAFAGGGDANALLMVKSKESANEAELIALDLNGRVVQRARTDYRNTLVPGAHAGKAVLVGIDGISTVSIPQ